MNEQQIMIRMADSENACTRARMYADGARGGAVDVAVAREYAPARNGFLGYVGALLGYRVTWNARKPTARHWFKGWRSQRFETEEEALAFAREKFETCRVWLANQPAPN